MIEPVCFARWTDEAISTLEELWPTHTAAEIARELGPGFNRNMVIGKAHRMQLQSKAKSPRYLEYRNYRYGNRP